MRVYDIVIPGSFLQIEDVEQCSKVKNLLNLLMNSFFEANISLNLFEEERSKTFQHHLFFKEQWKKERLRTSEIETELRRNKRDDFFEFYNDTGHEASVIYKRELWKDGMPSRDLVFRTIFIYAKSFIFALDSIERVLAVLCVEKDVPPAINEIHKKLRAEFPTLREVRNSTHHQEDRVRGLKSANNNKCIPLELKPVYTENITSPQGVLISDLLEGVNFGTTMKDGHYGVVEISESSMLKINNIVQSVYDAFNWHGPKQHYPT